MLLQTSDDVAVACERLASAPYLTVDTEFLSEKRYYPDLCLIQLGAPGQAVAVDPMAEVDLEPVRKLLADPDLVKVFHAGGQDVGIFLRRFGGMPVNLTDTQVMASVCGFGDQAGYAKLCKELLGVEIDKSSQVTDWSLRPLTPKQIDYALGDVVHLCDLYELLLARLAELGRSGWVAQELTALNDPTTYEVKPLRALKRMRIRRPTPRTLALAGALVTWREWAAVERNMPRRWIVADEALLEIAEQLPRTVKELTRVRRLSPKVASGQDGRAMLKIVEEVMEQSEHSWPQPEVSKAPTGPQRALLSLLDSLLQLRCSQHDVGVRLVASSAELKALVLGQTEGLEMLEGWRGEVFGKDALALIEGRLSLTGGPEGAVIVGA